MIHSSNVNIFNQRDMLGEDLVIIHLSMARDDKMERLSKRHAGDDKIAQMVEVIDILGKINRIKRTNLPVGPFLINRLVTNLPVGPFLIYRLR